MPNDHLTYGTIKLDGTIGSLVPKKPQIIFDQRDAIYSNDEATLKKIAAHAKVQFPKAPLEPIFQSHSPWDFCFPINVLTPEQATALHKWCKDRLEVIDS